MFTRRTTFGAMSGLVTSAASCEGLGKRFEWQFETARLLRKRFPNSDANLGKDGRVSMELDVKDIEEMERVGAVRGGVIKGKVVREMWG